MDLKRTDYTRTSDGLVVFGKGCDQLNRMVDDRKGQSAVLVESFLNHLNVESVFEVSCGLGTNLMAFQNLGVWVKGSEYGYMFDQVLPEIKKVIEEVDLTKPLRQREQYDLVLCTEVLEHIEEYDLETAIQNLKGLTRGFLAVTIPLIHKGYEACADHIKWEGDGKKWPRKLSKDELWLNSDGTASQGHVTMATEKWWEDKFQEFGLYRNQKKEMRILRDFEKGGIAVFYNLFLLTHHKPDSSVSSDPLPPRSPRSSQGGDNDYSSLMVLEKIEKEGFQADPGEMFFVEVGITNTSSRSFNCDASCENRIRIGVRFKGRAFTTQNLPVYLKSLFLKPADSLSVRFQIKVPYNPGPYLCEISLVEEDKAWFCDVLDIPGNVLRFSMLVNP